MTTHETFMLMALDEARKALAEGEIPVGAVLVKDGQPICRAHNLREKTGDPTGHAEILCMREGARILGDWRLRGCTLYVTLEPCPMCAGAIVQARVTNCVIGCMNPKAGCAGSVTNLLEMSGFNHRVNVRRGILENECSEMLSAFFRELRERKRKEKQDAKTEQ